LITVNLTELALLALVEGVADIFPIDASTHSMIVARLLRVRAGALAPALHLGAALALAVYFWRDMALIVAGLWKLRKGRLEAGTRLLTKMLIAALPFLLVESGLGGLSLPEVGSVFWIGVITLLCAVLMIFSDRLSLTVKRIDHIGGLTSLAIGLAQAAASIDGIGRLPAALILARLFGMERTDAFRFVLLSSLLILLVEGVGGLLHAGRPPGGTDALAMGLTFVAAIIALPVGFSLMRRAGLLPFALYRLLVGAVLVTLGLL
jgi:undecaprenyl-diphosphatase